VFSRLILRFKYNKHFSQINVLDAPKAINSSPERIVHDQLERAALKCEFAGNPKPEITWFRSHNQETQIGSGDFLEILELATSHAGEYICKAESVLGKAVSSVTLAVRGPPVITSQTGKSRKAKKKEK